VTYILLGLIALFLWFIFRHLETIANELHKLRVIAEKRSKLR
jgi:hypothetical protein